MIVLSSSLIDTKVRFPPTKVKQNLDSHEKNFAYCVVETWQRLTYPKNALTGRRNRTPVHCFAYSPEEAQSKGIQYFNHYKHIEVGQGGWFLTSDKMVVYCKKRESVYAHKSGYYLLHRFVTDMGTWFYSMKEGKEKVVPVINFAIFRAGGYRPLFTKNDYLEKLSKHRLKAFVSAYTHMVLKGKIDYDQLGRIISSGEQKSYRMYAIKILKLWKVKQMIQSDIKKALEKQGITIESAINKFEEAYGVAKSKKDAQTMTRIAEDYMELFKEKQAANTDPYPTQPPIDANYEELVTNGEKALEAGEATMEEEIAELMTIPKVPVHGR